MDVTLNKNLRKGFWGGISIYVVLAVKSLTRLAISIILIKGLSKEGYGIFKLFESLLLIGVSICSLGLSSGLLRYGTELFVKNKLRGLIRLLYGMMTIRAIVVILLGGIAILFNEQVIHLLHIDIKYSNLILVIALILFFTCINDLFGTAFHRVRLDQITDSFSQIVTSLIITIGFYIVVLKEKGLASIFFVMLFSEISRMAIYIYTNFKWFQSVMKKWKISIEAKYFDKDFVKRVQKFTLFYFVAALINIFRSLVIDNLIIGFYLDAKKVAIYAFAATLIVFADRLNIASIFRGILSPIFVSRYTETANKDELIWGFRLLCKLVVFFTMPAFLFLILMGDKIIIIVFSNEYLEAVTPMNLMCAFFFVAGFIYPFMTIINTLEKNEIIMFGGIFSVYNLIAGIILVKKIGIIGAVFATGSAQVLLCFFYWFSTKWYIKLNISFPWVSLLKTTINLFPIIILTFVLKRYINSISGIIFYTIVYGILYMTTSHINKIFDNKERNLFNNAIGKKVWVF